VVVPVTPREPASMAAPPAPTAAEWAFASTYKLKNSKGYRYTWGQQVRSMMGTAVEGPDQGMVRFRVEIAPDGSLTRLETLWSTSPVAERLARQAIGNMPRWPSTPTGKPLIFEKTISFSPFASDGPPLYKDDCLPDPPVFSNPFAWDGNVGARAGSGRTARQAGPPDHGGLPQATAEGLDRGGERTRSAPDGAMGLELLANLGDEHSPRCGRGDIGPRSQASALARRGCQPFKRLNFSKGSFSTKPTDRFAILPFSIGTGVRPRSTPSDSTAVRSGKDQHCHHFARSPLQVLVGARAFRPPRAFGDRRHRFRARRVGVHGSEQLRDGGFQLLVRNLAIGRR
jgi:hypothetical protein